MKKYSATTLLAALFFSLSAHAENSSLIVSGDLMIHPTQMKEFFTNASAKIQTASTWNWPEMRLTKPYKTLWSQVNAKGPFVLKYNMDKFTGNEMDVDMSWANPSLDVGQFEIQDQVVRNVGGARVILKLQGACSNVTVKVPNGGWKAAGRMVWQWKESYPIFAWQDFQFQMNPGVKMEIDMGQCTGPVGLQNAIKEAMTNAASDQTWLQDAIKGAMLEWVSSSMLNQRAELLKARVVTMRPGLTFTWEPKTIQPMQNGLIRIPGQVVFRKEFFNPYNGRLEVPNSEETLQAVTESGFVFPRETVPKVTEFLYRVGELQKRILSNTIASFTDLMNSPTNQSYVWPDLAKFSSRAVFYFDLMAETLPNFTSGAALSKGGFQYNLSMALLMYQWAPVSGQYIPYMDFRSATNGTLKITVANQVLSALYTPAKLPINYKWRSEIKKVRTVDEYFDAATFSSKGIEYLKTTPFTVAMPNWAMGEGLSLGVRDVQLQSQSLRVPLQILKSSK